MTEQDLKLRQLLQLKKFETPGNAYFDGFLTEFHRYQRSEAVADSRDSLASLWDRGLARLVEIRESLALRPQSATLAWSGGLAVLLLAALVTLSPSPDGSASGSVASVSVPSEGYVTVPTAPVSLASLPEELDLASISSFDRDFDSPRYVTGQAPGTYDSALAF